MGCRSSSWEKALRNYVRSVASSRLALMVTSSVALPIVECAFVNLLTSVDVKAKDWLLGALIVIAVLHAVLVCHLIWGEITNLEMSAKY